MAEPITPDELHAIPCISKKFVGSSFKPIKCTSRAEPGTAETPAAPSKGFIFCFRNRFIILAKIKPEAVAIENATAPRKNMPSALVDNFQIRDHIYEAFLTFETAIELDFQYLIIELFRIYNLTGLITQTL